jgi:hypothetical protein
VEPLSRQGRRKHMMRPRVAVSVALVALGQILLVTVVAGPARASCTGSPPRAPNAFDGTVVRLGLDDRQAFVSKDDGTVVEVDGGPIAEGVATGEDYHFRLGGRYEIDPTNAEAPLLVNDCTATTLLAMTSLPPTASSSLTPLSKSLTPTIVLNDATPPGRHSDVVPIVVFVLVATALGLFGWRQIARRTASKPDADQPG